MTRKITTILLALALCLTLLPVGAGAAGTPSPSGVDLGVYLDNRSPNSPESVTWDYEPTGGSRTIEITGYVIDGDTTGATYKLTNDVTIGAPLIIKGNVTLDLNGYMLKYENATQKNSVIVVADSAHFTLKGDNTSRTYTYTVDTDTTAWTNVAKADGTSGANTITLIGGVITGGTGTQINNDVYGGGVFVGSTANFEMTGGNIVGCTVASTVEHATAQGGGVFVAVGKSDTSTTKFTMTGGSIVGCVATGNSTAQGGGVCVRGHAAFTMNNARIANCTATTTGGGVYFNSDSSVFTMIGGTIKNCTAGDSGGGVFIDGGKVKNTSDTSSTIVYGEITKGNTGKIEGKRVTFMNGDDTYAETLAGVSESGSGIQIIYTPLTNAKISEPENPTKDGKTFLGWVIDNPADTSKTHCKKFDFTKDTVTTDLTLYAAWDSDFEVEVSDAQNNTDGYYKSFATAWDSDTGARGDGPTFKLLKDVNVDEPLSYSRAGATLDLNGHEFSGNIAINGKQSNRGYQLTLRSSADNGNFNGTVTAAGNLAQLKVTGGTVNKVVVGNGGTLDCIGGKIKNLDNDGGTVNHTGGGTLHYDGSNHWKICTVCGNKCDNAAHTGGTATCKDKAICTACGTPYGSTTPNNHAGTLGSYQHDKDSHWQVYSCCNTKVNEDEHSFGSDSKCVCGYEKPRRVYRGGGAPSISAVLSYPDAASTTNYTSGIYGLTFRSTASFSSFRGVQVDGKTIASSNYIAEEGSIVVYLKAVYLQTLPNGTHTVTILSTEGNATMDFTIGAVQSAKTGDAGVAIYALMALTSYTGTALVVRGRKRK